jgi:C4-dicarboxylate-specific signal transduction histidine kinase
LLEDRFRSKKITVALECERDACRIKADQNEMRQILLNLLMNSIDALETRRKRAITLRLVPAKQDLVLVVADNGIGMDEFTIKNIYAPFFSKKAHGTGLGLAVVKRIVDEYDGEIECRSAPGKGAEFEIRLSGVVVA